MEAKARPDLSLAAAGARFGFTVTKKLGNAVTRNRAKRRLREAIRTISPQDFRADMDYVVIAREPSLSLAFLDLKSELARAVQLVSKPATKVRAAKPPTGETP